jgi:RNA polymerase sigma-B factor
VTGDAGERREMREPLDDLRPFAVIGLLKAIDRFDPSRGCAFSSFAVPTIGGEIRRHLRDHVSPIRLPRGLQQLGQRLGAATQELESALGRSPTVAELAAHFGVDVEQVLDAHGAMAASRPASLDEPGDDGGGSLGDVVGVADDGLAGAEAAVLADHYLAQLPPLERRVLRLYFGRDLTQREIGAIVGVSQMQVSRLMRGAIKQLRAVVATEGEVGTA